MVKTTPGHIVAAILFFIISALLFYQSSHEPFSNVPADLNFAPLAKPTTLIPSGTQRPIPGAAPPPPVPRKDLDELNNQLMIWINGASQREDAHGLTDEQRQRTVILQGRLADVRTQLATGKITISPANVRKEIETLRKDNTSWNIPLPSLAEIGSFGKGSDTPMSPELFAKFKQLFHAGLEKLREQPQPDPLTKLRLQQLEMLRQDLNSKSTINTGTARLFLEQMLKPDQALPTLFHNQSPPESPPQSPPESPPQSSHAQNPADVIAALKDVHWKLTVTNDPSTQNLKPYVAKLLKKLQQGGASGAEVEASRASVIRLQNHLAPVAIADEGPTSVIHDSLVNKARVLCRQMHKAFPGDAEALGCPHQTDSMTKLQAETTINTVCERLRYSVPTVSPEQFGCHATMT